MPYNLLQEELHGVANAAKARLEQKYSIRISKFEIAFDNSVEYVPTFFGKTKSHYIVCEVASRPFPIHLKSIYADIQSQGLPVKLFIAYQSTGIDALEFSNDITLAKKFGIGLLNINRNSVLVNLVSEPVSIPLLIPESTLEFRNLNRKFSHKVEEAFSTYMNGNPRQAVQAIGQIIERLIRDAAIQKYGTAPYNTGPDPSNEGSAFGAIVDEMIKHSVLKKVFLNRVRAFIEDRNSTSHIARSIKKQLAIEKKYKLDFETGLRILKEIPEMFREKSLRIFKIE